MIHHSHRKIWTEEKSRELEEADRRFMEWYNNTHLKIMK